MRVRGWYLPGPDGADRQRRERVLARRFVRRQQRVEAASQSFVLAHSGGLLSSFSVEQSGAREHFPASAR